MTSLEFFAKSLNLKYEFEQAKRIDSLAKESLLLRDMPLQADNYLLLQDKLFKSENSDKKDTRSS